MCCRYAAILFKKQRYVSGQHKVHKQKLHGFILPLHINDWIQSYKMSHFCVKKWRVEFDILQLCFSFSLTVQILRLSSLSSPRWTWRSCARRTSSTRCRRSPPPTRRSPCSSWLRSTGGNNNCDPLEVFSEPPKKLIYTGGNQDTPKPGNLQINKFVCFTFAQTNPHQNRLDFFVLKRLSNPKEIAAI